ncbi:MAG: translation elongation factor 4 [Candidatus Paceibacterota bacterium]
MDSIRNLTIIAHIDHGKSTLADRMLEVTKTVESRKMREQVLDSMDLERERGITIKMQPVRMQFADADHKEYTLNLIDTPGHIDFAYEVSRALKAVEGSVLLVDATQGVQAQTLTTLGMARELGLTIIPAVSKIDSPLARVEEVKEELAKLLAISTDDVLEVSGKTGQGVEELLSQVVKRIAPPKERKDDTFQSLVFDFQYSNHRGVIVFIRVLSGEVSKGVPLKFKVANETFQALEVGIFSPTETPKEKLSAGEIGYIVTGIKQPGIASVGDTVSHAKDTSPAFPGYMQPKPVVWASVYPESQDDFSELKLALGRLKLSDSSLAFEEEASGTLGRGFRCGLLGMLHLEIVTERLRREFNLELIVTTPTITYFVTRKDGEKEIIYSPSLFPDDGGVLEVHEPWVQVNIIVPSEYLGPLMTCLYEHEAILGDTENFGGNRTSVSLTMPLRELMRNFFDELKSLTSGYASISYEMGEIKEADVVRLDILVSEEVVPAFSRVVSRRRVQEEAEKAVEKLHTTLPRQNIVIKIQAQSMGRILSSKTLSAFRKDVTQHMYGGDITRKMKLREKQKKGKKKMQSQGKVHIPHEVFLKMMRTDK